MSPANELAYRIGAAARRPASWLQLVKFGLVGGSGYLINLAVFAVLTETLGVHHVVAAVGAFCVAVTNNFLLNRHWTFAAGDGHAGFQAMRFFAVSIAALMINLIALEALVSRPRSATCPRRRSPSRSRCRSTSSATSSGPSPRPSRLSPGLLVFDFVGEVVLGFFRVARVEGHLAARRP